MLLLRAGVFPPGESESVEHGDETCEAEARRHQASEEQFGFWLYHRSEQEQEQEQEDRG